ncbi:MAG TPA: hypothetical protein VD863_25655, partial [Bradyrhizobium sp.]|nr:hypothetical protein [Bradyrhizobium sp.]
MRRTAFGLDAETLAVAALLAAAVVIGLGTVDDYGVSIDEWNADPYGPKSLAWYTSGFVDRSSFESVEETLWYYGPWFHILVAIVQSLGVTEHWATRHAMTFLVGIAGIAALLPIARLAIGRWAGLAAVSLCLITGYLFGSLFFTPIDVPFMFAMLWATCGIVWMASQTMPAWPATIVAGIFIGLAIATRSSGIITHVYLAGAMALCALEVLLQRAFVLRRLAAIAIRTIAAVLIAWITAYALWPWLQVGNPFVQFKEAFQYFANHPASFEGGYWGLSIPANELPWHYIPGQMAARLPEGFLLLLVIGLIAGVVGGALFMRRGYGALARRRLSRLAGWLLIAARARGMLIVWAAALLPVAAVIIQGSTLYDGIRHVMFLIPMAALIAGYGFVQLLPLLRRAPVLSAIAVGAYAGY